MKWSRRVRSQRASYRIPTPVFGFSISWNGSPAKQQEPRRVDPREEFSRSLRPFFSVFLGMLVGVIITNAATTPPTLLSKATLEAAAHCENGYPPYLPTQSLCRRSACGRTVVSPTSSHLYPSSIRCNGDSRRRSSARSISHCETDARKANRTTAALVGRPSRS